MRILFVAPNIPLPGTHGGSTHVTEVIRALRTKHEVLAIARRGSRGPGVVPIGLGTASGPAAYALAATHFPLAYLAARRFAPHAIYERFSAHGLGVLLGRALDVPVVSMVLDRSVTALTLRGADRLITTAPHLVSSEHHHKLVEVSWGANTETFRPDIDGGAIRRKLGLDPGDFAIGYTGAFYAWHGLETLVRAAERIARQPAAARARYVLVGDGSMRPKILAMTEAAGLQAQFILPGRVAYAEVPTYLAAFDACVAPYNPNVHPELRGQGMFFDPLKVFEYLACGKPTITLDSDNIRRLFRHNVHALLVRPGDPEALGAAILDLLGRPDRGRALGEAGHSLVATKYTWQAHGDRLGQLFRELVAARRGEVS